MLDKEFGANYLVTGKPLNFNHGDTSASLGTEKDNGHWKELMCFSISSSVLILSDAWAAIENPLAPHAFDCCCYNLILYSFL